MAIEGISTSQIDSMLALLRNTAAQAAPPRVRSSTTEVVGPSNYDNAGTGNVATVSFADALRVSLSQSNQVQAEAQRVGNQFAAGDNNISLSDVMIATQKANIALQTTVQVRNKVVAAYNDIMNMQI
jgi:flagellar hook-basal body complex protein FliE